METSLLLESSIIFENPTLLDQIRQSLIDIQSDPPEAEEIDKLLNQVFIYMSKENTPEVYEDLLSLAFECFSKISSKPNFFVPIYEKIFSLAKTNSYFLILTAHAISIVSHIDPRPQVTDYKGFVTEALNQVLEQVKDKDFNNVTLQVFQLSIDNMFKIKFFIDLIRSSEITETLVKLIPQYIFKIDVIKHNRFIKYLVSDIAKKNLLHLLPEDLLLNKHIVPIFTDDQLINLYDSFCKSIYVTYLTTLAKTCITRKNSKLSIIFIKKINCFHLSYDAFMKDLLETLSPNDLSPEVWDNLKQIHFLLPEKLAVEFKDFSDPVLALRIMPNPSDLPPEVLEKGLMENTSFDVYERVLTEKLLHPILTTTDFWIHFSTTISDTRELSNPIHCFFANNKNDLTQFLNTLIFHEFPPKKGMNILLQAILTEPSDQVHNFNSEENVKHIFKHLKAAPILSFWRIFPNHQKLLAQLYNSDLSNPIFLYGYSAHFRATMKSSINKISILPQTESSIKEVIDILKSPTVKSVFDIDFETKSISNPALSIIVGSRFFYLSQQRKSLREILGFDNISFLLFFSCLCKFFAPKNPQAITDFFNFQTNFQKTFFDLLLQQDDPNIVTCLDICFLGLSEISSSDFVFVTLSCDILNILLPLLITNQFKGDKSILTNLIISLSYITQQDKDIQSYRSILPSNLFSFRQLPLTQIKDLFKQHYIDIFNYFYDLDFDETSHSNRSFNLAIFDQECLKTIILDNLQKPNNTSENHNLLNFVKFISKTVKNIPTIELQNSQYLIDEFHKSIEENKWDDCSILCKFMQKCSLYEEILKYSDVLTKNNIQISLTEIPLSQFTIDSLLSLILESPKPEGNNDLFNLICKKCLSDDSVIQNYLVVQFENLQDHSCLKLDTLCNQFLTEFSLFEKPLIETMHRLYFRPPETQILISKPNFDPFIPISPKNDAREIVSRLLSIATERQTFQAFVFLKNLSNIFPFMFIDYFEELINSVLPVFEYFQSFFNSADSLNFDQSKIKASFAALNFLNFALHSPQIVDKFIIWLFENIRSLSDSQVFAMLPILQCLISVKSLQFVIIAFMIKYSWPEIVTELLKRNFISQSPIEEIPSNDDENETKNAVRLNPFTEIFLTNIFEITTTFYKLANSLNPKTAAYIIGLQEIDNPCSTTFDHSLVIPHYLIKTSPQSFIRDFKFPQPLILFLDSIGKYNHPILSNTKATKETIIKAFNQASPNVPKYTGYLPDSINREAFDLLPFKYQSTALYHTLYYHPLYSKIPNSLNTAMNKYLISQPNWVYQFIFKKPSLLMLPEHYGILLNVFNDLLKLENETEECDPEEVSLLLFLQAPLFEEILHISQQPLGKESLQSLLSLFKEISKNDTALLSLLECINSTIVNATGKSLMNILQILYSISTNPNFKSNMDIISSSVLDAVCAPENRKHEKCLKAAATLFSPLAEAMPNRITHLIGFMLLSGKSKLIHSALDLCLQLGEQRQENVMMYIQNVFDRAISSFVPSQNYCSEIILQVVKKFPTIATARQPLVLNILKQLLSSFEENFKKSQHNKTLLNLIGSLFTVLAPHRNRSQSIRLSDSLSFDPMHYYKHNQSRTIPPAIFQQNPEFWQIFEEHRTTINKILENKPSLLKTSFKFLDEYPELTEFNVRVSYFHFAMREKIVGRTLEFRVRRQNILTDSYMRFHNCKVADLLKPLHVTFIGEQGIDAGGLRRDWFTQLVKEIFNPNYALFIPSSNKRSNQPNPSSYVNTEHMEYFRFAGRIIARALIDDVNLDAHLTTSFCKQILQTPVALRDVEDVDESLHQSLQWILDNDVEPLDMYFTADIDDLGEHKTIDLKPNGSKIKLTNDNKEEFVNLMVEHRLKGSITSQVRAFCNGFNELIPLEEIRRFSPNELDLLICGVPEIDVKDLQKNTEYQKPYSANHPVIKFFFQAISKWDNENLAKLLLFITGSSQVPTNGFKAFKDMNQPITIAPGGSKDRLPAAHTCYYTLDLPEYDSEEELNHKLIFAIQECNSFGFI